MMSKQWKPNIIAKCYNETVHVYNYKLFFFLLVDNFIVIVINCHFLEKKEKNAQSSSPNWLSVAIFESLKIGNV